MLSATADNSSRARNGAAASRAAVREWYRPDRRRSWLLMAAATAALTFVGAAVVVAGVALDRPIDALRMLPGVVGILSTFFGVVLGVALLRHITRDDTYVGVREDGLVWRERGEEQFLPWEDCMSVEHDVAAGIIRITPREGAEILLPHRYSGISQDLLAQRLEQLRRKGQFGLLSPRDFQPG